MTTETADGSNSTQKKLFITLVHGTWPRGLLPRLSSSPSWFEKNSEFRTDLQDKLELWRHKDPTSFSLRDIDFVELKWSGANSILARGVAAKGLAEELKRQRETSPEAERVVIAHSHGGNVALQALNLEFGKSERRIRLITLATPFLKISESPLGERQIRGLNTAMKIFVVGSILAGLVTDSTVGLMVSLAFYAAAVGWLPFKLLREYFEENDIRAWKIGGAARQVDDLAKVAEVLVLRGVDDEASLTLAVGAAVTRFTSILMSKSLSLAIGFSVCLFVTAVPSDLNRANLVEIPPSLLYGFEFSAHCLAFAFMAVSFIVVWGWILSPIAKSIFGWELLWASRRFTIAANSVPDINGMVEIRTIEESASTRGKLRHGLYEVPMCRGHILSWLVRNVDAGRWHQETEAASQAKEMLEPPSGTGLY